MSHEPTRPSERPDQIPSPPPQHAPVPRPDDVADAPRPSETVTIPSAEDLHGPAAEHD